MEEMELVCFKIISAVGEAKSEYIMAVDKAEEGLFEEAEEHLKAGEEAYIRGHKVHAELIAKEASGESCEVSLLLLHAEDQLMGAETAKLMADKLINLYKRLGTK